MPICLILLKMPRNRERQEKQSIRYVIIIFHSNCSLLTCFTHYHITKLLHVNHVIKEFKCDYKANESKSVWMELIFVQRIMFHKIFYSSVLKSCDKEIACK